MKALDASNAGITEPMAHCPAPGAPLESRAHCAGSPRRVFMLGATATIGQATVRALVRRGHELVCFVRPHMARDEVPADLDTAQSSGSVTLRIGAPGDAMSLARDGFRCERFDAIVSCMASRTGTPRDAWAIDHRAQVRALEAARKAGVAHFVPLSAICVQKPRLAFQHAKLAFEKVLVESGMAYSIVRPTAFFKSLSGQIERVRRGKPYLLFGDGTLTACKSISDDDLGACLADCLDDDKRRNRILPGGGPGPAITPRQQGEHLFALLGRTPRFKQVPLGMLDAIIVVLAAAGRLVPALADKAELARIGRYYASESMLLLNPATGHCDAGATPATGSKTLFDFYARVIAGAAAPQRGDHAVF